MGVCVSNPTWILLSLIKLDLGSEDACIPCLETENLCYFEKHNIGHIEFSDILYSARRHPTKLSEAYPSPYICRYALRRWRTCWTWTSWTYWLLRAFLFLLVILFTFYILWTLDINSHALLFWDSDTRSTIC